MSELDLEAIRLEALQWSATSELRWRRPKRGHDHELILEQLYERVTGERSWRPVPKLLED